LFTQAPQHPKSDRRIAGYTQSLVDDLTSNAAADRQFDLILLEANRGGIEQISEILAGSVEYDAVHLVSHGSDGRVQLGNTWLDINNIARYASELENWQSAFGDDADLLIYGCDLAASGEGRELLEALSASCDCDVAASDDLTGHAELGGDWTLEFYVGSVETEVAFSLGLQSEWIATLDMANLNPTQDAYIDTGNSGNNYGAETSLVVDQGKIRTLMQFDVSSIPVGATINSATLQLNATSNDGAFAINVYEVTQSWTEGIGTGNSGTVNWDDRMTGTAWASSGGDYDPTIIATSDTASLGIHSWDVTSLVQDWYSGATLNNGLILGAEGGGDSVTYDSREGTIAPVLVVDYTPTSTPPVIANLAGDSLAYNEGDGAVVIEQGADAMVTDADSSDFDTGTLTVAFQAGSDNTEDVLAVRNQGSGFGQIGVSGSNVTYEGTTIGTFTGGSGGVDLGITLNANADAVAVSALLNNVTYEDTDIDNPTTGARTVRYVLTDGDGGTSANYDATVTVSGVNDVPTIANLAGDRLGYNEGDGAVVIEQGTNTAVTDVDSSDLDTGTLTVSFQAGSDNTEDVLAVRNQGTGFGQIWISGSNVTYEGTTIGTFTGGSDGVDLVITLNANADAIAVSALLNNVTYENTDIDNPTAGARTVRYVLTDGDGGTSANYDATVTVNDVNDVPTIANLAGDSLGYIEGDGVVVIEQGTDAAVTDVDSSDFDTGTLTVSFQAGEDSTEDVLAVRNQGTGFGQIGVSGSNVTYEGTTIGTFTEGSGGVDLVITLNANADAVAVSALLNNVTYENTDVDNPTVGARTVRYVLTDGDGGTSPNYDATVTVSDVNDVPTIANLAGDSLGYIEGDGVVVIEQGANAAVTDVDSSDFNTGALTVSFPAGSDNTEDVLAVRNQGTGFGQIGVSGSNVTYEGTTIGTFTGGSGGVDLGITLNSNADAIAVSALLNNVTYENTDIDIRPSVPAQYATS